MNCPKCDKPMEHMEAEPDVNMVGGWECSECEVFVPQWETDDRDETMKINGYDIAPYANLSGANLSHADLSRADLIYANLIYANLSRANLNGANLSRADLIYANLSRADLTGANLSGADLSGADLSGAKGYIDLGYDPRGYHFRAVKFGHGWQITAGCRNFTVEEALAHWANNPDALTRVAILDAAAAAGE